MYLRELRLDEGFFSFFPIGAAMDRPLSRMYYTVMARWARDPFGYRDHLISHLDET